MRRPPIIQLRSGPADPLLQDGQRSGDAQAVPGAEIELGWKSTQSNVTALVLHVAPPPPVPAEAVDGEPVDGGRADDAAGAVPAVAWPAAWVVERRSGRSWLKVARVKIRQGWDPAAGPLGEGQPAWVEFEFPPLQARALRVRPAEPLPEDAALHLHEVEVLTRRLGRR